MILYKDEIMLLPKYGITVYEPNKKKYLISVYTHLIVYDIRNGCS